MKIFVAIAILAMLCAAATADVYLHMPRGSNNRVNDNDQAPANRLFDSQNNNNAGYNSGEGTRNSYYTGSMFSMEWTAQHGCGADNGKLNCEIIIQYRCDDAMRNGVSRNQPQETDENGDRPTPPFEPTADRGRHEPYANWYECRRRSRNRGLFLADQNVGGQARNTRQNPGGNRSGYECAEERDYYPYWHPSAWMDIVVMTDNTTRCDYYQSESQNVMSKWHCSVVEHNNEEACVENGGTWLEQPSYGIEAPECIVTPWSRQNHHGNGIMPNTEDADRGAEMVHYNLTLMDTPADACVLRLRYNMSTNDYDGWTTDRESNGNASPVQNDPEVDIGIGQDLELNINTNQFGRTFQDRSHVFSIEQRPQNIPENDLLWNLAVRGKRGNNQQVYPNVEYDFTPNRLHIPRGGWVHWQWTGSNNNPQGNDRSNVVQIADPNSNYPLAIEDVTMFPDEATTTAFATSNGATDPNLQDVDPYFNSAPIQYNEEGVFHYMSTKNNAFSNRSQKGTLLVGQSSSGFASLSGAGKAFVVVGAAAGGVVVVGGAALLFMTFSRSTKSAAPVGQAARF